MHNRIKGMLAFCAVLSLMSACKRSITIDDENSSTGQNGGQAVTSISISLQSITGSVGANCTFVKTYTLVATTNVSSNPLDFNWSSSNTAVATVDTLGHVTLTGATGNAKIIAAAKSNSAMTVVTTVTIIDSVCAPVGPNGIGFVPHGGSFPLGTIPLAVNCGNFSCPNVTVSSSNTTIVSVPNPNTSSIVCLAVGTARVTVSMTNNGVTFTDSADFICTAPALLVLSPSGQTINLNTANGVCSAGLQFNASVGGQAVTPTWTTSGGNINASGFFTASVVGPYTITATYNGLTSQIGVTVAGSCAGSGSIVVSLPSLTVNNCSGFVSSYTPTISVNGQNVTGTWTSSNTSVASVNAAGNGFNLTGTAGTANVTVSVPNVGSVVIPITVNQCASGSLVVNPNSISINNCSGFAATYTPVVTISGTNTQVSVIWSNGGSIATTNGASFTLTGTVGSITLIGTTTTGAQVFLPVTVSACPTTGTIVVTPNPLNVPLSSIGTLTATLNNVSGTPNWTPTLGCVTLATTTGTVVNVNTSHICKDSVVASIGNVKGFAIVNVTSNSTACAPISGPTSVVVNNTANLTTTGCGPNQPYWFSRDPSRFTVVGAPFVCVINGTSWPCGTSATIKAIAVGSTTICIQPAVQDPTNPVCQTETATATASGDLIPNDGPIGIELKLPDHAPPKGAKVDAVYTWGQYVSLRKLGMIKE